MHFKVIEIISLLLSCLVIGLFAGYGIATRTFKDTLEGIKASNKHLDLRIDNLVERFKHYDKELEQIKNEKKNG